MRVKTNIRDTTEMTDNAYLTTGEVALRCGVSVNTVVKWLDLGTLEHTEWPSTSGDGQTIRRIKRESFVAFLATYETK
jgi:excisionase family DNA binding protein